MFVPHACLCDACLCFRGSTTVLKAEQKGYADIEKDFFHVMPYTDVWVKYASVYIGLLQLHVTRVL